MNGDFSFAIAKTVGKFVGFVINKTFYLLANEKIWSAMVMTEVGGG
ncbi:hypothetical protein SPONN_1058 [uncultured Candidatus Thioglobus sp.]|nr:hypothetical protein SPONL_1997 [uncultured Candidatus Thioglobus sp.]SMN02427.1 hypothetical protein SPONN_1058 [uncultured Candidatus Thioglobus sp.]